MSGTISLSDILSFGGETLDAFGSAIYMNVYVFKAAAYAVNLKFCCLLSLFFFEYEGCVGVSHLRTLTIKGTIERKAEKSFTADMQTDTVLYREQIIV